MLNRFIHDAFAPGVDPEEGHVAVANYAMEDVAHLVTAPTLLIGADADPFAFPELDRLATRLAARELERRVIVGGTIPLMEQEPEAVADAVRTWLVRFDS